MHGNMNVKCVKVIIIIVIIIIIIIISSSSSKYDTYFKTRSQYSEMATDWKIRGSNLGRSKTTRPFLGIPSLLFTSYCGSFPAVSWSGSELDHSPVTIA